MLSRAWLRIHARLPPPNSTPNPPPGGGGLGAGGGGKGKGKGKGANKRNADGSPKTDGQLSPPPSSPSGKLPLLTPAAASPKPETTSQYVEFLSFSHRNNHRNSILAYQEPHTKAFSTIKVRRW